MTELIWPICFFAVVLSVAYAIFPRRVDAPNDAEPTRETPETRARKYAE